MAAIREDTLLLLDVKTAPMDGILKISTVLPVLNVLVVFIVKLLKLSVVKNVVVENTAIN